MEKVRFYIVSLKWTNKNDKWITFSRSNYAGYCLFKEWCGLYLDNCFNADPAKEMFVDSEKLKSLWIKIKHEGYEREVLPNTAKVRKILGVEKNQFLAIHKTVK